MCATLGCCTLVLCFLNAFLADTATGDNKDIGVFLWRARLLAFAGRFAPQGLRAAEAAALAAFAASVWMVNRVHGSTADRRPDAHMARAARFPENHQMVSRI